MKRQAQSLYLLMTDAEQKEDDNLVRYSLEFPDVTLGSDKTTANAKSVKVHIAQPNFSIVYIYIVELL